MKKLLVASAALVAVYSAPAVAADMAVKAAPVVARPACAQFGGFYLGGQVGYGYYNYNYHDKGNLAQTIDSDLPTAARLSKDGWNAGVQGGYNYQSGCSLFGVEADWSWTDKRALETYFDGDAGTQDSLTVSSRMKWFGTLRARSGVVVDNLLLYVTGGLAYANFDRSFTVFEDAPATTVAFNSSGTRWGWTAGLGSEWAFSSNWSLKSEVLYMRFTSHDTTHIGATINAVNFGVPGRAYAFNNQDEAWITRIGVNYRFGGGGVLARY
jgi:outer membrane immunogenic protein